MSETTATTLARLDAAAHRQLGVDLFNHVWTLIEQPDRSAAETDEMIHAAHASRYHWSLAGTTANLARGEWQCARVYAVLGDTRPVDALIDSPGHPRPPVARPTMAPERPTGDPE